VEYVEPLRDDIKENFKNGWENGTKPELANMKLLDSFLKESQRMNPPIHLSFFRNVKEDITLSDGLRLPAGIQICVASGPIARDTSLLPGADTFDGFRWARQGDKQEFFVTTTPKNLHFGYGKYACPGRFFASNEIKIILTRLLLEYEFRFQETQKERPKNLWMEEKMSPNPRTKVLFRRRTVNA